IIGRGGRTIKNLAVILEEDFNLPNPQISVAEIEIPELDAHVMASRVASALRRGVHFRRAGYWALNQIMDAGALGVEITISGRLRTMRARREKFRGGYMPKSGEPVIKYVRKAVVHVQLKSGVLGVKMLILPPGIELPDQVEMLEAKEAPEEMNQPASEEEAATVETTVEAEE
ncbi:MAG: 30S ribosomal protein S3, partial [Candidatus Bathyarchaeota archaeon]|nr:30S ribosomal protein S3 [Candidatus Bathyarchaeota archaeon]